MNYRFGADMNGLPYVQNGDAFPRIAIFPGAGSFGAEFRPLLKALRPRAWLMRYDWRDDAKARWGEVSFAEAAETCARDVLSRAHGAPVILLGHSFGAYVVHATTLAMQAAGQPPQAVVLVGAAAPSHCQRLSAPRTEAEVAAYWNQVEQGLLDRAPDHGWRDMVVETTCRDLALYETYDGSAIGRMPCTVHTAAGVHDPLVSAPALRAWSTYAREEGVHRIFDGGHSEMLGQIAFINWIADTALRTKDATHVSG